MAQFLYFPASCQGILCHGKVFLTCHRRELFDNVTIDVCREEDNVVGRVGILPGTGVWKEMMGNLERRPMDWNETRENLERTGDWNEMIWDLERMTVDWNATMGDF